jgi:3-hydroxyisobutyrate dehydrogenase
MTVAFLGLGLMGRPMASNLVRAGTELVVWNRNPERTTPLAELGAAVAGSAGQAIRQAEVVLLMLSDQAAIDQTLGRGEPGFADTVAGRTFVHLGTTEPEYSLRLQADLHAAGARYVEAPVSGSRGPAESGELVAMLAGEPAAVEQVAPLLAPICSRLVRCGPAPRALLMKLAVNTLLITMVTGLAEAYQLADGFGLDPEQFVDVLAAGPMASRVSVGKAAKLLAGDFTAEAAIADVLKNNRLVAEAARQRQLASPLIDVCQALFDEAVGHGLAGQDMAAVLGSLQARTARLRVTEARTQPPVEAADQASPELGRQLWQCYELIHDLTYFSPHSIAQARALGFKGYWMGYFGFRAAPLGPVGPAPVHALFYGFSPHRVHRALPDAWQYATPAQALAARAAAADQALTELLDPGSDELAEAAELAWQAARAADITGRGLAAANQALARPELPHVALWQAATVLREHRGDGHVAVLVGRRLDPIEAHLLKCAIGETDEAQLRVARGFDDAEWVAGRDRLVNRGLIDQAGRLTDLGRAEHRAVEAATDLAAVQPWQALGSSASRRLLTLLEPMAEKVRRSGLIPQASPVGLRW